MPYKFAEFVLVQLAPDGIRKSTRKSYPGNRKWDRGKVWRWKWLFICDNWKVWQVRRKAWGGIKWSPIGNGRWNALYLWGIKISDLVPFWMSQTLMDYHTLSCYLLQCFSVSKISKTSIIGTLLMIWLVNLVHIDKGNFFNSSIFCFAFQSKRLKKFLWGF